MKSVVDYSKWMSAASELLRPNEFKVFVLWFGDAGKFSAGAVMLGQRLPGIDPSNIRRSLVSISEMGFLKKSGVKKRNEKGSPTTLYLLGDLKEVCKRAIVRRFERSNRVDFCSKCLDLSLQHVEEYPNVCRCEAHSVLVSTHVLEERVKLREISTDQSPPPNFSISAQTPLGSAKEDNVFLDQELEKQPKGVDSTSMAHHTTSDEMDGYAISATSKELNFRNQERFVESFKALPKILGNKKNKNEFVDGLFELIRNSHDTLFNNYGDPWEVWSPDRNQVMALVKAHLLERFKDSSGLWSMTGSFATDYLNEAMAVYDLAISRRGKPMRRRRPCSLAVWKIYEKVDAYEDEKKDIEYKNELYGESATARLPRPSDEEFEIYGKVNDALKEQNYQSLIGSSQNL